MMHDDYDPATGLPKERNIPGYDADEHASVADFVMGELEAEGFISPAEEDGAPDRYVVTSESVTEGHPDKMCDAISDAILDAILEEELAIDAENGTDEARNARCAVETFATMGGVIVSGEVRTRGYVDVQKIVRDTVNAIGYDDPRTCFDGHTCSVMTAIHEQSPDIAQGVDESFTAQRGNADPYEAQGAGDQGIMFGYASNESETLMPLPIFLAHRLAERLAEVRKEGVLEWVCPDGKTQVSVAYEDGKPVAIDAVVVSTQHDGDVPLDVVRQGVVNNVIRPVMEKYGWGMPADEKVYVNPTGRFVLGGAAADTGLTGRKVVVDTYGGIGKHGGGAFSGKDASKVDRSAAYAARHVAKNIVAAGLADRCEVQLSYAIGVARPISVWVECFGTEKVPLPAIRRAVDAVFDLRPAAIIENLDLIRPIYSKTSAYGHFGRELDEFTWEKCDKVELLRRACGLE